MVPERALGAAQSGPLPGSLQTGTVLPMLNPPLPQHPILKLHWPGETSPLHPVYPRDPNPPNALVATGDPLPGSQTHPAPSLGRIFMVKHQPSPALPAWACTTWGRLLMAGHWCQPILQYLSGRLLKSVGPRQMQLPSL